MLVLYVWYGFSGSYYAGGLLLVILLEWVSFNPVRRLQVKLLLVETSLFVTLLL